MATQKLTGKLEVICGSMFSGKSEELIRRMRRAQYAQQKTQVFKHSYDNRKTIEFVHAHSGDKLSAFAADSVEMLEHTLINDVHVIGIDEAQFYSHELVIFVDRLIDQGKRVIVAGLDLDFRGVPFGPMPTLMAMADEVTKLKAVCMKTGQDAHFTQRLVNGNPAKATDPIILIGAEESYEARARNCYESDKQPLLDYVKKQNALSLF